MQETIEHRNRVARKEYSCDYCGGKIKKGETYDYYKGKCDGYLFDWHSHLACQRVAEAIWDYCDPDDGMDEDQFQDGCAEVCGRFICPDCPEWNKEYDECENDESFCIGRMDVFFKTHELYKAGRRNYYVIWKCRKKEEGEHE